MVIEQASESAEGFKSRIIDVYVLQAFAIQDAVFTNSPQPSLDVVERVRSFP